MTKSYLYLALLLSCAQPQSPPPPNQTPTTASAPAPEPFGQQLESYLQPLITDEWAMGIVVGVVTKEKSEVFSFGKISQDNPNKPDENTLFEIGSLTKIFTTTLLAQMVIQKEVALSDPIQQYLPEDVSAPRRGPEEITLLDLATHTSGLPVVSENFWPTPVASRYDPNYAGKGWSSFTEEKFYAYFKDPTPPLGTKKQYMYSNLGLGLLGHLLARKAGKTYEELLTERVLAPLHLDDTRITLSDAQRQRLAPGHDADNTPTDPWKPSALSGAFALKSSAHDLLLFVKANLGLDPSPLAEAIKLAHQAQFKKSDLESIGLGWNLNSYGVVFHTGTTGGYRSVLFMIPARQVGVVVLTNTLVGGSSDGRALFFEAMGGSVLNLLVGVPPLLGEPAKVSRAPVRPADYIGVYGFKAEAPKVTISAEGDTLYALIPGRVRNRIYPDAKDSFFMKAYEAHFIFQRDEQGEVINLKGTLGDKQATFTRFPLLTP